MNKASTGYLATEDIQTTISPNQEILPAPPVEWTIGYMIKKLSFNNLQDCHVIINGKTKGFLRANDGFEMDYHDREIFSFVIVEPNIQYYYWASY